jgi:hypothetical protein
MGRAIKLWLKEQNPGVLWTRIMISSHGMISGPALKRPASKNGLWIVHIVHITDSGNQFQIKCTNNGKNAQMAMIRLPRTTWHVSFFYSHVSMKHITQHKCTYLPIMEAEHSQCLSFINCYTNAHSVNCVTLYAHCVLI